MDKSLKTQNQSLSTHLQDHEIEIAKSLFYVNLLTPFRVEDFIIEQWSITVSRMLPDVTSDEIQQLMDDFMTGEIEYDHKLGIQNIFKGITEKFPSKYYKPKMVY